MEDDELVEQQEETTDCEVCSTYIGMAWKKSPIKKPICVECFRELENEMD